MKKCFLTAKGPKAVGPYSTAVEVNGMAYLSGMLGLNPETGKLEEGVEAQAKRALDNIRLVLGEMGLDARDTVKTTVYLTNLGDFKAVNAIYGEYFAPDYPARSCVQVAALPLGALVEIEATVERRVV